MKSKSKKSEKKILALIDGNAIVHRAYHALPSLTTKDGKPSGAVYGFALTLFGMMEKVKPDYIIASFDVKGPTFRHKEFKEYKANRKKAPDELYEQIPMCHELLKAYGVPIYTKEGYEADDILGTISKDPEIEKTLNTLIVTGDMDLAQLVDEDTSIFTLRRGVKDTVIYDEEGVKKKYGIRPDQIVDYKALRGDASDNIPGVKGVGEKTAIALLQQFGSLKNIYENLDKVEKKAVREKLRKGKEDAFLSYKLATIVTDLKIRVDLADAEVDKFNREKLMDFFKKMGFQSLYKKMTDQDSTETKKTENQKTDLGRVDGFEFEELSTAEEVKKIVKEIKKEKTFSYFIDNNEKKSQNREMSGFGVYIKGRKAYYISNGLFDELSTVLLDESIKKNGYDTKLTPKFNICVDKSFFDVKLAGYLLGQNGKIDLEKSVFTEFGESFQNGDSGGGQASLLGELTENKKKLVAEKAYWVGKLAEVYQEKFENSEKKLAKVFYELEMPLIAILAKMEINGIKVDRKVLEKLSKFLGKKLTDLEKKIYELTGEKFNINSPSQLAEVLFQKLKLPTVNIKRGKIGYSTDAEQLEKLKNEHPVIEFIEEYRLYAKLKNTYADPLPELIKSDGRIHTNFNQMGAITGRLSSSDPNLQNIPKYGKVSKLIRQSFVAEKGKVLVSADYSQIDLRVAAHLSGDPKMMEIFQAGKDIHRSTAAWVNGIKPDEVSDRQRSEAKALNFGVLYGMGTYGFMRNSGVSQERAEFFIKEYMKTFSKLKEFIEKTKETARKNGFIETEFGRRRYFPNIKASNYALRSGAERSAINFPIQGLAADIMKLAILKVDEFISKNNQGDESQERCSLKTQAVGFEEKEGVFLNGKEKQSERVIDKQTSPRLELQIHDELIMEVSEDVAEDFAEKIKEIMEGVYKLRIPLVVETNIGKNWGDL